MKKLFSIVLVAAGMFMSANVSALDLAGLKAALASGENQKLTLDQDIHLTTDDSLRIKNGQTVTINMNGFNIIRDKNLDKIQNTKKHVFYIYHGTLDLQGKGSVINLGDVHTGYQTKMGADSTKSVKVESTDPDYGAKKWIVKNESKGVVGHYEVQGDASCVYMIGSNEPVANYSVLKVGKDVVLNNADGKAGVNIYCTAAAIDQGIAGLNTYGATSLENEKKHAAYGVVVDIYGSVVSYQYGVQVSGNIGRPADKANDIYAPTITLYPGSKVEVDATWPECTGVYCAGFGNWTIKGEVKGNVGAYIKSGNVDFVDATIVSTNTEEYTSVVAKGSGIGAQGSAIVIESNKSYAGGMDVTIAGDTKVQGGTGLAIDELVTNVEEEKLEDLDIQGGTFIGGDAGCVSISDKATEDDLVTVQGGSYTELTGGFKQIIDEEGFTTLTKDKEGNDILVVSKGDAPENVTDINAVEENSSISLNNAGTQTLTASKTLNFVTIEETVINIPEGKKLEVVQLVFGANGQIVVEAGAELIVKGDQGIVASDVDNIVLKAGDANMGVLKFSPNVTSNKNPRATVIFKSESYTNSSSEFAKQRLGIPTIGAVESVSAAPADVAVSFQHYDYEKKDWSDPKYLNIASPTLVAADLNVPFISYLTQSNRKSTQPEKQTEITLKGSLVGNSNPTIDMHELAWIACANSYSAKMNIWEMLQALNLSAANVTVYVNTNHGVGSYTWTGIALSDYEGIFGEPTATELNPMQPFMLRNSSVSETNVSLNYGQMVWNPSTPSAPRRMGRDITTAQINMISANGNDRVRLMESNEFSAEFDNGYDVEKMMNDEANIYVTNEANLSDVATNNLENAILGFETKAAGTYTINFTNVKGDNLVLVDLVNNREIAIVEGAEYQFEAKANTVNPAHFQVRKVAEVATNVENAAVQNDVIKTIVNDQVVIIRNGVRYNTVGQRL